MYFYHDMRKIYPIIILLLLGCKDFEVRKVSADDIFREEVNQIDWKNVDTYPSFEACKDKAEKGDQKTCFRERLVAEIMTSLSKNDIILEDSLNETLILNIEISEHGKPQIVGTEISLHLKEEIPEIEDWLSLSIEELSRIYPAEKRGVPVAVKFQLPLRITASE